MTVSGKPDGLDRPMAALLFPDTAIEVVRGVLLLGTVVDAAIAVDVAEHRRRQTVGLGGVAHPRLLRRLLGVPTQEQVEDPLLHAETSLLPAGLVERDEGSGVRRLLRPPLRIAAVAVRARREAGHRQVRAASLFAGFSPRWVVAERPRVDPSVVVAAAVYDVGIATHSPAPDVVVQAGPPRTQAAPEWAWCLAEQVYAELVAPLSTAGVATARNIAVPSWLIPT
ncbi:MAG: hypothetical protein ACQSGP_08565 [Frankia sp.]